MCHPCFSNLFLFYLNFLFFVVLSHYQKKTYDAEKIFYDKILYLVNSNDIFWKTNGLIKT